MLIKNPRYETTAVMPSQYPDNDIPEITLVGRSNVGKSSLLNCMVNRKNLARVGNTPGKTRKIHFFNMDDLFYFVDLPGYGYAKVSKEERESWGALADAYLNSREQLKMIIMIVDIRHEPTGDDRLMYEWIASTGVPHVIVVNKLDKIKRSQVAKHIKVIEQALEIMEGIILIPFSAEKRQGRDELWREIEKRLKLESTGHPV